VISPLYEMIQLYGTPDVVRRADPNTQPYTYAQKKLNKARREYLTTQAKLTYEEFLELSKLKFGSVFIAKRLGYKPGTIHNMREAGRAYLYWREYNDGPVNH
jgi:hypothetical protein